MKTDKSLEFEKELVRKYPLLYRDMHGHMDETCMHWGICVDEGWWPIIEELSEKLEKEIDITIYRISKDPLATCARFSCSAQKRFHTHAYILSLITLIPRLFKYYFWRLKVRVRNWFRRRAGEPRIIDWTPKPQACRKFIPRIPVAAQVKEKFGGLRFYMDYPTNRMNKLIDEAEEKASKTCELCGQPGEERPGGWIQTLCDICAEK